MPKGRNRVLPRFSKQQRDMVLFIPKRILAILMGFFLFPLKSLFINAAALLLTLVTLLLAIPALVISQYNDTLDRMKNRAFAAITATFFFALIIFVLPFASLVLGIYWATTTAFDVFLFQPFRGIYHGVRDGLENVVEQLTTFSDSEGNVSLVDGEEHISNFSSYIKFKGLGREVYDGFAAFYEEIRKACAKEKVILDKSSYAHPSLKGNGPGGGVEEKERGSSVVVSRDVPPGRKDAAPAEKGLKTREEDDAPAPDSPACGS